MPTFATRPLTTSSTMRVEFPQNYYGRTAKAANVGIAIRQIPFSTIAFSVEDTIQKSSDVPVQIFHRMLCRGSRKWRWLILWYELKSSRTRLRKEISKLQDGGGEDCICSEQYHPEFPVQEESHVSRN